jgi:phenylpyruvate tautomerase PptA (4-oxalocrotonate tautomerase family)
MPIVEVEVVLREGESLQDDLASKLADAIGEVFASPPGNTWLKLRALPVQNYAENAQSSSEALFPVFVSILKANSTPTDQLAAEVEHITRMVAQLCNRPNENVHIIYLPSGTGRAAFGGRIV